VLTTCPECGGRITRGRHTFDVFVGRRTVAVEGDYARCTGECAEFYFAAGETDAAMSRATEIIRAEEGLLTPDEIKAFRKSVGLTQPQLEHLLGAGLKTVTRWEKGTVIQNGATDTLLRLLRDVPQALQHLLQERQVVPKVIPLVPVPRRVSYSFVAAARRFAESTHEAFDISVQESTGSDGVVPIQGAEKIA
jgi:putative zinc finger/helix-turn-helix YgiT family protein